MTTRRSRPGITLTEVLIAMFVMALGMIALLTLFPLGVFQIGQALKDDRVTQTASQADGFLRAHWRTEVLGPLNDGNPATLPDPLFWAMDDPNLLLQRPSTGKGPTVMENHYLSAGYRLPTGTTIPQMPPLPITATTLMTGPPAETWNSPDTPAITPIDPLDDPHYANPGAAGQLASYPVIIDPLGFLARPGSPEQHFVARNSITSGTVPLLVPRRNLSPTGTALNNNGAIQTCCLVDDFTFRPNGSPTSPGGTGLTTRQGRYSWAAVIQRPVNATRDVATLKIMVFDGRPPLLATPGDEVVITQSWTGAPDVSTVGAAIPLTLVPGSRSVSIRVPNRGSDQTPLIRKGGWIMDGTIDTTTGIRHANFYRIAGVTEGAPDPVTNTTPYTLDLETEIKRNDGQSAAYPAQIYLFANLSEVFDRPALQPDQ